MNTNLSIITVFLFQGAHAVKSILSVADAYMWFDKIYNEKLDYLSNDATSNMTTNEVIRFAYSR